MTHRTMLTREEGQGLAEYGLIIILAAIAVVAILTLVGPAIGNMYSYIKNTLPFG
mgnify:CR=1 FL=1